MQHRELFSGIYYSAIDVTENVDTQVENTATEDTDCDPAFSTIPTDVTPKCGDVMLNTEEIPHVYDEVDGLVGNTNVDEIRYQVASSPGGEVCLATAVAPSLMTQNASSICRSPATLAERVLNCCVIKNENVQVEKRNSILTDPLESHGMSSSIACIPFFVEAYLISRLYVIIFGTKSLLRTFF